MTEDTATAQPEIPTRGTRARVRSRVLETYVKQIASLWLTPLYYTSEEFAAVTEPVLILIADRDEGAPPEGAVELFHLLSSAELAGAPASDYGFIEAKAGLLDTLALDFLARHRNGSALVSK
jgi:hypothetical protein